MLRLLRSDGAKKSAVGGAAAGGSFADAKAFAEQRAAAEQRSMELLLTRASLGQHLKQLHKDGYCCCADLREVPLLPTHLLTCLLTD